MHIGAGRMDGGPLQRITARGQQLSQAVLRAVSYQPDHLGMDKIESTG